jgi:hypothetical protein
MGKKGAAGMFYRIPAAPFSLKTIDNCETQRM